MSTTTTPYRAENGWCDQRATHDGRFDHWRNPNCVNFVSEDDHQAVLEQAAAKYDARATFTYSSGATNAEANYVEQVIGR